MANIIKQRAGKLPKIFKERLKYGKNQNFKKYLETENFLKRTLLKPFTKMQYMSNLRKLERKGDVGEHKLIKEIKQNIEGNLFNRVYLKDPYSNTVVEIDHLLITKYGIFILETKNWQGYIKTDKKGNWYAQKGSKLYKTKNPVEQVLKYKRVVDNYFKMNKIKTSVTPLVVFTTNVTIDVANVEEVDIIYHNNIEDKITTMREICLPSDIYNITEIIRTPTV